MSLTRSSSDVLLLRHCAMLMCSNKRDASTARMASKRPSQAVSRPMRPRASTPKSAQYIKPEEHQEPERVRLTSRGRNDERVQLYHCGAVRAATAATIKVTNLLVLAGTNGYCFWNGISWLAPSLPAFAVLGQLVWTGTWAYLSSPMVVSMWITKPKAAARSADATKAWLKSLPLDTLLELRTFRVHAAQKTTTVTLKELREYTSPWWRAANLQRVPVDRDGRRPTTPTMTAWWRPLIDWTGEPRRRFYVPRKERDATSESAILAQVFQVIRRNTEKDSISHI